MRIGKQYNRSPRGGHAKIVDLSKRKLRSAISNGRYVLADVDHRGPEMRRLRDLLDDHIAQISGDSEISHSERVLCNRASMLTLLAEMQEKELALNGFKITKPTEFDSYLRSISVLSKILCMLGLKRRSRDLTPTLDSYLRQNYRNGEGAE